MGPVTPSLLSTSPHERTVVINRLRSRSLHHHNIFSIIILIQEKIWLRSAWKFLAWATVAINGVSYSDMTLTYTVVESVPTWWLFRCFIFPSMALLIFCNLPPLWQCVVMWTFLTFCFLREWCITFNTRLSWNSSNTCDNKSEYKYVNTFFFKLLLKNKIKKIVYYEIYSHTWGSLNPRRTWRRTDTWVYAIK